jgi:hypothetical protein
MPLAVIGAGFSRTGTLSLKRALELIGFGPCFHEVDSTPASAAAVLRTAFDLYPHVNWDKVFEGYTSAVDDPASVFYKQIADWYPSAKVILTVREPNSWFPSAAALVRKVVPPTGSSLGKETKEFWDKMLSGFFGPSLAQFYLFRDRESVIAAYEQHNAEVRRSILPNRLLVFDVKQGWEPLCEFLRVPIPTDPFPHANARAELETWFEVQCLTARREGPA